MLKKSKNTLKNVVTTLLFAFIITGCGEQTINEKSEEILDTNSGDTRQNLGSVVLSGKAIKGVVKNANVSVYVIKNGKINSELLATAHTNTNGEFSVRIPRKHARRLLYLELTASNSELSPTMMTCDAFSGCGQINGELIQFGDSFPLKSDFLLRNIVKLEGHEEFMPAHFSPLRHMVVAQVEASADGFTWNNVDSAGNQVAQLFSLETPVHKLTPVDLTGDAETLNLATDEEIIAAIIDASFLNIGESPNYKAVEEVLSDLTQQQGVMEEGEGLISASEVMLAAGSNVPNTLTQRTSVEDYFSVEEKAGKEPSIQYSLSLGVTGEGSVSTSDNSIYCEASLCTYDLVENISLTATAMQGYQFDRWEGACANSTSSSCSLSMSANTVATAIFTEIPVNDPTPTNHSLSVRIWGAGNVSVTDNTPCTTYCIYDIAKGQSRTLVATPPDGYRFDSWIGQCENSSSSTCVLTVNADTSIIASFKEITVIKPDPTDYLLSLSISGSGTVKNIANDIDCSSTSCSKALLKGTNLTLMATATQGFQFDHWELSCPGSSSAECLVSMNSNVSVMAVFTESPEPNGSIDVNWTAPTEREDGTALASSEIKQYTIYYRESLDQPYAGATSLVVTDDGSGNVPTSLKIPGLEKGKSYYLAGVTIDTNGLTSQLSNEIEKTVQ